MNQNDQIKMVDGFNIIDLMGLREMSEDQKNHLLLDMNNIVWSEFLQERLQYIFTAEQVEKIYNKINLGEKLEDILDFMGSMSSNFVELLAEFTRTFKIAYVRKYHQNVISDMDKILTKDEVSDKFQFSAKREKSVRAIECIDEMMWKDVIKIFYPEKEEY